jgi:uncharacterized protein YdhG (YjbR/CyaY superfamily)
MNPSSQKKKIETITDYINTAPEESQEKLREIRKYIHESAPDAQEGLKWGMPAFSQKRILVTFAGFKHHIGFYVPYSTLDAFKKELAPYKTASTSVQFPIEQPLPHELIRKMTKFRLEESTEDDAKWKTK